MNSKVDFASGGIAIDKERVLIVKNRPDPARGGDGYWGFPKGHLEEGENPLQAALREVQEETGFVVQVAESLIPISETKYTYSWENVKVSKTVWYYKMSIVKAFSQEPDNEVEEVAIEHFESAYNMLSFEKDKKLLRYVSEKK